MTDNEIIKDSEYTKMIDSLEIRKALLGVSHWCTSEYGRLVIQDAIDLIIKREEEINRQKSENDALFLKLSGVMHFVDKWLDGEELNQDETNKAATMREKTLQITEKLQHEKSDLQRKNSELKAEIERLKAEQMMADGYAEALEERAKTEAIKEFVGRLKKTMDITYERVDGSRGYRTEDYFIDNLVKEMTEEKERDA